MEKIIKTAKYCIAIVYAIGILKKIPSGIFFQKKA